MTVPTPLTAPSTGFIISGVWYDRLKWISTIVIPALITLLLGIGIYWNVEMMPQIAGTISLIGVFLGACIGISANTYNKSDARFQGTMNVGFNEQGSKVATLELNGDPNQLELLPSVSFKVNPAPDGFIKPIEDEPEEGPQKPPRNRR